MSVQNPSIRVRFAPSPTGYLHIGGARTALFNWLFARHHGGTFVLRIEDTDETRSTDDSVSGILEGLSWLGLDWDEGPDYRGDGKIPTTSRGAFAPYFQMQRLAGYKAAADRLIQAGLAFPCFATSDEVEKAKERALLLKQPPRFTSPYRDWTPDQQQAAIRDGRPFVIRFKTPRSGVTRFSDLVRGELDFENELIEDFILLKTSGVPTYNFACVVDDHAMEISHVIRGDDHLSNTPRQKLVYEALGWKTPEFAHLAMIMGSDGSRLSKRHGATSVMEYKELGYLPEVMLNYLALLGWGTEDSQQLFTRDEMIAKFELARCSKSPATFDPAKLLWMNGEYLRQKPAPEITRLAGPFLAKAGLPVSGAAVENAVALEREKAKLLADVPGLIDFLVDDSRLVYRPEAVEKTLKPAGAREIVDELEKRLAALDPFDVAGIEALCKTLAKDKGVKNGAVFHPLRVCVSGRTEGPSLWHMVEYLGKERTLARIARAKKETL